MPAGRILTKDIRAISLFYPNLFGWSWNLVPCSILFNHFNSSFFMAFIDEVLQQPSYGWMDDRGLLIKPTLRQLYAEAFSRINIFKSKKNWISLFSWVMAACMLPFFLVFLIDFISWKLVIVVAVYAMIIMSTH